MQFDPAIHTKEYLMGNPSVALELAQKSSDFAKSDLADDISILKLSNTFGGTVAHSFAKYQLEWLEKKASKNLDILKIIDNSGWSVAHTLAKMQSEWVNSDAAQLIDILIIKDQSGESVASTLAINQPAWVHSNASENHDVLKIVDIWGWTVAHLLAFYQPEWIFSKAAFKNEILQLKNNAGRSVAFELIGRESCLTHAPIFTKEILTIVNHDNILLAEGLVNNYAKSHDLSVAKMAVKLISLGAAYKHSKIMTVADGQTIFKETKQIIEDCLEPEVAQKIAQALYSTCFHNIERIKLTPSSRGLEKWKSLLKNAEAIMRDVILKHPNLGYSTSKIDFFCEPSADLVSRLKAETLLNNLSTHELNQAESNDDLTINNGLY